MISVVLSDDHHLVRQGIKSLLEKADDIQVIAEADNGQLAIKLVQQFVPDVLIIDISMPGLNGIQAIEHIQAFGLPTRTLILSMHSDSTLVRQALRAGANGYLLKRSVVEELLAAVRAAEKGETYLSPFVSAALMTEFVSDQEEPERNEPLSLREREVLKLVAEGRTNKQIAALLNISIKTIEKHRTNLMSKLDVHDLASLLRIAIKSGLISFNET